MANDDNPVGDIAFKRTRIFSKLGLAYSAEDTNSDLWSTVGYDNDNWNAYTCM